jgi:hypothetical protein
MGSWCCFHGQKKKKNNNNNAQTNNYSVSQAHTPNTKNSSVKPLASTNYNHNYKDKASYSVNKSTDKNSANSIRGENILVYNEGKEYANPAAKAITPELRACMEKNRREALARLAKSQNKVGHTYQTVPASKQGGDFMRFVPCFAVGGAFNANRNQV